MRYVLARLPAPIGQIHPLSRFLREWMGSQIRSKHHFCDHWIIALREHRDRYRNPVLSASPVSLHARALKPFHWNPQARGLGAASSCSRSTAPPAIPAPGISTWWRAA